MSGRADSHCLQWLLSVKIVVVRFYMWGTTMKQRNEILCGVVEVTDFDFIQNNICFGRRDFTEGGYRSVSLLLEDRLIEQKFKRSASDDEITDWVKAQLSIDNPSFYRVSQTEKGRSGHYGWNSTVITTFNIMW